MKDKLDSLFEMQTKLNDAIFQKKDIRDRDGNVLTTNTLNESSKEVDIGPNSSTNEWLQNFLIALNDESRELKEELLWKWWSKDKLHMENIKVEIIDQLHFWLALALTSGMDAQKVFDIYMKKNAINFRRQEDGYSKLSKK